METCSHYKYIYLRKFDPKYVKAILNNPKLNPLDLKHYIHNDDSVPTKHGSYIDIRKTWMTIFYHYEWHKICNFNDAGTSAEA